MAIATGLAKTTLDVIKPLCPETERMFNPVSIASTDRVRVKIHKDGKHFHLNFYGILPNGALCHPSYYATTHFVNKLVDKQQQGKSGLHWVVGATDINALLLNFHWDNRSVIFDDPQSRQLYSWILTNFAVQTHKVQTRNDLQNFEFVDSPHFPLARYQKEALKACMFMPGYGLFMEQGTGKTAVVIARICNEALKKEEGLYRAIVMCPKAVRTNWKAEIDKFSSCRGVVEVIEGDQVTRLKRVVEGMQRARLTGAEFFVAVISQDSIGNSETLHAIPWDLGVIDESHGIKDAGTKRWKAMQSIRNSCTARMVLTGTPITNNLFDLWTQFEFMYEGGSGFTSFAKFKKFYGEFKQIEQDQNSYSRLVGLTNVPMVQERLARQAFLISKKQALPSLPPKVYDIHEIEMGKEQRETYNALAETLVAQFEEMLANAESKKEMVVVNNILTQMLRLSQITAGFVGIPEIIDEDGIVQQEKRVKHFKQNPKIDALVEILKDKKPHQKTIIWTNWVPVIQRIEQRFRQEGINAVTYYGGTSDVDRQKAVTAFNEDPNCRVLIGNPRAGGVGLTLLGYKVGEKADTYCDHVIYVSQGWSLTDRAQSEDRPHRRGTVSHVQYTDLVVPATIDEEIRIRVLEKRLTAFEIQDIKEVITRIMKG